MMHEILLRRMGWRRPSLRRLQLIDLVIAAPLVTADVVATALSVTPQAARSTVAALGFGGIAGRGRLRA